MYYVDFRSKKHTVWQVLHRKNRKNDGSLLRSASLFLIVINIASLIGHCNLLKLIGMKAFLLRCSLRITLACITYTRSLLDCSTGFYFNKRGPSCHRGQHVSGYLNPEKYKSYINMSLL